jgi:exoribonuclease II
MSAARSHVRAGSHAVLAADGYVQATSPLRRAGDLLAQRQLIAALRGKRQALSGSNIRKVMRQGQDRIRRQRAMERDGRRYFTLVALAQRGLGTRLRGQLVDDPQRQGRHLAFAMELCLPVELPGHAGEVGSWCEMEVEQILPMEGRVVVSVCS